MALYLLPSPDAASQLPLTGHAPHSRLPAGPTFQGGQPPAAHHPAHAAGRVSAGCSSAVSGHMRPCCRCAPASCPRRRPRWLWCRSLCCCGFLLRHACPVCCGHAHLGTDFSPLHPMASPLCRYAYLLRPGGLLYTITDVEDLGNWQVRTCTRLPAACCAA